MNLRICHHSAAAILVAALLPCPAAHAQLGNLGSLSGALPGSSLTSGSAGNVAGLLEFCIKNNYLGSDKASEVKNSLMGKLPAGSASSDSGYRSGSRGILSSNDGSQLDLSGGGMKKQVTRQICDKVLDQGKSML